MCWQDAPCDATPGHLRSLVSTQQMLTAVQKGHTARHNILTNSNPVRVETVQLPDQRATAPQQHYEWFELRCSHVIFSSCGNWAAVTLEGQQRCSLNSTGQYQQRLPCSFVASVLVLYIAATGFQQRASFDLGCSEAVIAWSNLGPHLSIAQLPWFWADLWHAEQVSGDTPRACFCCSCTTPILPRTVPQLLDGGRLLLNPVSYKLPWQVWDALEVHAKHPAAFIFDAPSGAVLQSLRLEASAIIQGLETLQLRSFCWSPGACHRFLVYGQPSRTGTPSLGSRGVLAIVDVVQDKVLACSHLHGTREQQQARFDAVTWHPKAAGFMVSCDVELEDRSCFWQAGFAVGVLPAPYQISGGFSVDGQRIIATCQDGSGGRQELLEAGELDSEDLDCHHFLNITISEHHICHRGCPQSIPPPASPEEAAIHPSFNWLQCDSEHVLCVSKIHPNSFVATLGSSTHTHLADSVKEPVDFSPLNSFIATMGSWGFCILMLRSGRRCWSIASADSEWEGQAEHVTMQNNTLGLAGSVTQGCAAWLPSGQGMVLLAAKRRCLDPPSLRILMFA